MGRFVNPNNSAFQVALSSFDIGLHGRDSAGRYQL